MNMEQAIEKAKTIATNNYDGNHFKGFSGDPHSMGATRHVLLQDQYAFKAVYDARVCANRSEWDFYAMVDERVRQYLAKPLYITECGKVLVMERLSQRDIDFNDRREVARLANLAMREIYGNHGRIGDLHGDNLGKREDGKILILDYGFMSLDANRFVNIRMFGNNYEQHFGKYSKSDMADFLSKSA